MTAPAITDGEVTRIAFGWSIERRDGAGLALTSHDRPISRASISYDPAPGLTPASISRSLGLDPQSAEVGGAFTSASMTEEDLSSGRYDGAQVRLVAFDWAAPEQEAIDLLAGELGNLAHDGCSFSAELRGAADDLTQPVCPATSPECRAELGDKRCRVDMRGRSVRRNVVGVAGGTLTLDDGVPPDFLLGRMRYLSGSNCGLSTIILAVDGTTISLRDLPRTTVATGCTVELREGCDKRLQTCVSRFANAANFRGEPHLPGNDLLTRYPGA